MAGRGATPSGRPDDIWRVEFYFEPIIWNIPGGTQRADGRVYNSARQQTCFLDSDTVTRLKNEGKNTGDIVTRFEPMDATGIKYFTSVLTFAAAPPEDRTRESALLAASRGTFALAWRKAVRAGNELLLLTISTKNLRDCSRSQPWGLFPAHAWHGRYLSSE